MYACTYASWFKSHSFVWAALPVGWHFGITAETVSMPVLMYTINSMNMCALHDVSEKFESHNFLAL